MILTIKTLQQKTFKVEIDDSETVAVLKQKIETEQGPSYPANGLKLIHSGKILEDGSPISQYNIQESSFVVVMVAKAKVTAPTTKPPETSTSTESTDGVSQPPPPQQESIPTAGVSRPPTSDTKSTTTTTTTPTEVTGSSETQPTGEQEGSSIMQASSELVTGSDYERAVKEIMEMGFNRDQVVEAMTQSYNNPHRAVAILMGEVEPPGEEQVGSLPTAGLVGTQESLPGQQPPAGLPPVVSQPSSSAQGGQEENPLQFLEQLPQFQNLRREIQNNHALLPLLLQQIGQSNPQLLQIIQQNQEAFINMLNGPVEGEGGEGGNQGTPPPGGIPRGLGSMGGMGGAPPGTVSIPVSPQDKEAIDRLKAMGFPEHMVVQAYFACDKNEELAANFLLQDRDDDN